MVDNATIIKGGPILTMSSPDAIEGKIFKTEVTVEVPVFIPIPEINDLRVKTEKIDCILSLKHTKREPQKDGIILQGNTWFEGDRWGRVYRSSMKIIFDHSSSPIELYQGYPDDMFHKALEIINRIIEIARVVIDKFFLYKIVDADITQYIVTGYAKNGRNIKNASFAQTTPGLICVISQEKTFYHFDKAPEILEILCSEQEIPLEKGLLRNAYDFMLSENFRSVVIEAQTAIEITIKKIIRDGMIKAQKPSSEIDDFFENMVFMNLIKDHLFKYTKSDFTKSGDIYEDWKNNCYGIRNAVAHKGYYPIKLQAEGAINAAKNAIKFLEENTNS